MDKIGQIVRIDEGLGKGINIETLTEKYADSKQKGFLFSVENPDELDVLELVLTKALEAIRQERIGREKNDD